MYVYVAVQASISLYLLYGLVGNSMFAGLAVLVLSAPITVVMCKFAHRFRNACMKAKDKRIKVVNETLNAIKVGSQSSHRTIAQKCNRNCSCCAIHLQQVIKALVLWLA